MNRSTAIFFLCAGLMANTSSHAQEVSRDLARKVARAVARVGIVWPLDDRYNALHKELSDKYENVPSWEIFKADERWIVATARDPMFYSGTLKSRSKAEMDLQNGDIVELAVADRRSVKTYQELTNVTKVLCKFGTPEYDECAKANPVAWFDKEGKLLDQP